jgi:hypothetical protein
MKYTTNQSRRPGGIMPLVVISLVGLIGFVAMAVDVGMIALARTQVQHVADTAAMTAARTLNGSPTQDLTRPVTNARLVAATNQVLSDTIPAADVAVRLGAYHYDEVKQTFVPQFPPVAPDTHNLAEATVVHGHPSAFGVVFGVPTLNVTATAIAAHRPRDVGMILDFSGSMNNESDLWNVEGYLGSTFQNTSNNSDTTYPQFGPYKPSYSPLAALEQTSSDPRVGRCNVTQPVLGVAAMVNDYYQHDRGGSPVPAFQPAPSTITNTAPGGDQYRDKSGTPGTPAKNWQEITNSSGTPFGGYANFKGWTQGPGYWGKTFYIWPPDPDPAKDWRKKFFLKTGGSHPTYGGPVDDNRKLWTAGTGGSAGNWNNPVGNYVINYKAILKWIKDECVQTTTGDGKPFPPKLRAGRILFYDHVPTDLPAAAYDHANKNDDISWANQSQRFWKEYIDYTLGLWRDPYGNVQNPNKPACSMGGDFTCGSSTGGSGVQITGPDSTQGIYAQPYIAPLDNPRRPRHRFWFGPMTMIQYMSDTGLLPGTARDISLSVAKLGINGALVDIQNNHPNDLVTMLLFNRPQYSNDPPATGSFNNAQFALSRDYAGMIKALWYPPNSATADVLPWDANGLETARGHGDYNANTATMHGFLLAYNQMSGNSSLKTITSAGQPVGGFGRKGAQRIIVLETDGMANVNTHVGSGFANNGPNNSFYRILPGDSFNSTSMVKSNLLQVVQAICNKADGTPGSPPGHSPNPGHPGYATATKPVLIHTLAFGAVFEPTASGTEASNAVALLQDISNIGGTVFPSSSADPANGYKWIIGTLDERKTKLQQAFRIIMDTGTSVSIVR